jgi:hypothetical protein
MDESTNCEAIEASPKRSIGVLLSTKDDTRMDESTKDDTRMDESTKDDMRQAGR